jgi:hypothetical protein
MRTGAQSLTRRTILIASRGMKNFFRIFTVLVMAFISTGCVGTVDNRKVAGVPLVKDKIVRVYERPVLQTWGAAKDVLAANGTIIHEDVMQSTLTARIDTRTVRVKVEAVDAKMSRVTTQVRTRMGNSDLDLGGEIDKQIALRLATGQTPTPAPSLSK